MPDSFTTNLNLTKPEVGASRDTWGTKTNGDWDLVDAVFAGAGNGTSVGLNVGSGKTLSVAGTLNVSGTATLPAGATAGGATVATTTGTQTLTNKTLTTPVINGFTGDNSIVNLGSGQLYKDASGNVGIGTTMPATRLDVARTGANAINALFTTGVDDLNFRLGFANGVAGSTGALQATLGLYYLGTGEAATINFHRGGGATDGAIAFRTNAGVERMRIDSSGNMGLGVASPAARFDLGGDYKEGVVTANTGSAYTIALTGTVQNLTLTGNCTFTFPAATTAGRSFLLILRQDATGSRTVTWAATVRWPGGTAPTITATASRYDLYAFTADGSVWLGRTIAQNYSA